LSSIGKGQNKRLGFGLRVASMIVNKTSSFHPHTL
jgi:hypothetical protein